MAELILQFMDRLQTADGTTSAVRVFGEEQPAGTWVGWLEFVDEWGERRLRTGRETTQPDRPALAYWASGLGPVYWEGALRRARRLAARGRSQA